MATELPKAYNPKETEDKIYRLWQESGFFTPENLPGKPGSRSSESGKAAKDMSELSLPGKWGGEFVTCIAPPNITGELHMGHALEYTLQDIVVRAKRMQGYKTLWLPGTDHAGIAAQNAVERQLAKEGTSRHELGREKFLERMREWRDQYGNAILEQLKKLGASLDWTRLRFTLDPDYQQAVQEAFLHYYKKGWIYQGERVINWCVHCATAISDLEVNYVPEKTKLYFIKYGPFTLATVRPETKLGDTALAVHPDDERYKKYVGNDLEIETVDNGLPQDQSARVKKIKIKIVADKAVDSKFGTGIVKVTPAHDLTDFEIAQRHNLLSLKIIDEHGRMNENAGLRYQGLKTAEAREKIVADLQAIGLIEKIEDYEHNIARCDRCNSVIEPLPSKQWFLKMKELAELALKAMRKKEVQLHPERWQGPLENWLNPDNIRDWNISRQLWWGHQLPVWFCAQNQTGRISNFQFPISKQIKNLKLKIKKSLAEQFVVSAIKPKQCPFCKTCSMIQSADVLDTWFSSALWPFATLGWPQDLEAQPPMEVEPPKTSSDFKEYYPTNFITSDRGILFLWQARMVFSGLEFTGKAPFKDIYIHATVLTKDGKRMSKSLGTGVNPLELIEKYGADALRFGLASQATGLQDLKFGEDLMVMGKKFANKLWNIARYVIGKVGNNWEDYRDKKNPADPFPINGITGSESFGGPIRTILERINERLEQYQFSEATHIIYDYLWHEIADKYIEKTKSDNSDETKKNLVLYLVNSLKMLHPFMPFVTEEIYTNYLPDWPEKKLLLVEDWPSIL